MGNVFIDPNLKRETARIDPSGNIINPRTKEIITPAISEYVEPTTPATAQPQPVYNAPQSPTTSSLSIQEQIDEAKQNLIKLEELKKLKIAQMEAELQLLKQ